jgi:hypothetical protein
MRARVSMRVAVLLAIAALGFAVAFGLTSRATGQPGPGGTPGEPHGPGLLTAQELAERFHPGPPWNGQGSGRLAQADLEQLRGFPAYWPGERVGIYNLQAVGHADGATPSGRAGNRPREVVTLIYGTCTPEPGLDRCQAPVTVHIRPACFVRPEEVPEQAKAGRAQSARGGARFQRFADGSAVLWTERAMISIVAPADPQLVGQVVAQLRRADAGAGAAAAGQRLRQPDFGGCS